MLPEDELQALADSIADVGLLEPLTQWADPDTGELFLLDGRNRAAACELAGIEPDTITVNGDTDPIAYVLARNETRRHMTKGQRAMAAWMTAATDLSPRDSTTAIARQAGVVQSQVGMAKVVAEHAPDLVPNVIGGATSLKGAYDDARERRSAASSTEAQLDGLRRDHPDLATQVVEETLSLNEAIAAATQRDADRAQRLVLDRGHLADVAEGYALAQTMAIMDDDYLSELTEPMTARHSELAIAAIQAARAAG